MNTVATKEDLATLAGLTLIRTTMITGYLATEYEDGRILIIAGTRPYLIASLKEVTKSVRKQLGWLTDEDKAQIEGRQDFLLAQELIIELAQDGIKKLEAIVSEAVKAKELNQLPEIGE